MYIRTKDQEKSRNQKYHQSLNDVVTNSRNRNLKKLKLSEADIRLQKRYDDLRKRGKLT